jgi:hypothetical protein
MRFRYDGAWAFPNPDRAEFFMPRERTKVPQFAPGDKGVGKGLPFAATKIDYDQLYVYTEAAAGRVGAFVELSYVSIEPTVSPAYFAIDPATVGVSEHQSGFGDMVVGTKTLLLDCELLQFGFEFKTFLPTGNFLKGLGTAHVSLEPSLLLAVRLCPDCYLQHQMSYWIPLGGDTLYQGNVFHNHLSLNYLLCHPCPGVQLVSTAEINQWVVLSGAYTSPSFLVNTANGLTPLAVNSHGAGMVSAGPGLRLFVCDKIDIGAGTAFALTGSHWADQLVRVEFRWRF